MRCPACQEDNKEGEPRCQSCGADLKPASPSGRGRSRRKDPQGPLSPQTLASNRAALRAYRLSIFSLVPGVGLVLGPLALILGSLTRWRCLRDSEFTLWGPLLAAMGLGAAATVCNWVGFALMYLGLRSAGIL